MPNRPRKKNFASFWKPLFKMKVQLKPSTKPTYHKSSSQLSFLPSSWFKTCDKHAMLILLSSKSLFRKKVEHIFLNMDTIKPDLKHPSVIIKGKKHKRLHKIVLNILDINYQNLCFLKKVKELL